MTTLIALNFTKPHDAVCFNVGFIDDEGFLIAVTTGWRIYQGEILPPQYHVKYGAKSIKGTHVYLRPTHSEQLYTLISGKWHELQALYPGLGPLRSELEATWNCRITDHLLERLKGRS